MQRALELARQAALKGEVPVGALLVCENSIITEAYNERESKPSALAHAEITALEDGCRKLGRWRLTGCTLYVTLEPCVMCAGALHWVQLQKLVYGASDLQRGFSLVSTPLLHPKTETVHGVKAEESRALINTFFKNLRD